MLILPDSALHVQLLNYRYRNITEPVREYFAHYRYQPSRFVHTLFISAYCWAEPGPAAVCPRYILETFSNFFFGSLRQSSEMIENVQTTFRQFCGRFCRVPTTASGSVLSIAYFRIIDIRSYPVVNYCVLSFQGNTYPLD